MQRNGASSAANDANRQQGDDTEALVRAFLIADVCGYTSFTQAHGDEAAGHLAATFASLAREAVAVTGGEVIELRGDEALCVFPSARQALRAAVAMQVRFRDRIDDEPVIRHAGTGDRGRPRVGTSLGPPACSADRPRTTSPDLDRGRRRPCRDRCHCARGGSTRGRHQAGACERRPGFTCRRRPEDEYDSRASTYSRATVDRRRWSAIRLGGE